MKTLSTIILGVAFALLAKAEYNCNRLNDCQNSAVCKSDGNCTCTNQLNTYYNCKYDITTPVCNTPVCLNGGTCLTVGGAGVCACAFGYYGATCEKELVVIDCLGGTAKYTIRIPETFAGSVEVSAATLPTPTPVPCVAAGQTADGYKEFAVTFDIGTGTTNCPKTNLETNTTAGDTSYTAKFLVRYSVDLMTSIDELYTLTCTHTGSEITVYKEITDVSLTATDLDTTEKEKQFQSVAMTLLKGNAPLAGPIVVGTVFEVVVFVDDPEAFADVFIDSCIANNTLAGAAIKTYEIFKSGCPTAKGKMTTGEQDTYSFMEGADNKTGKAISIQAFKFRDSQKLGLTCTARMCKNAGDPCARLLILDDTPADCDLVRAAPAATTAAPTVPTVPTTLPARKKRAADEVTEETVSTVVTVLNPGETLVSTSTVAGNKTSVADPETCLAHGSIVSVIAILGGLVGILLLACLALACVIMRRREPKLHESVAHSSGFAIPRAHTNGAYTREY